MIYIGFVTIPSILEFISSIMLQKYTCKFHKKMTIVLSYEFRKLVRISFEYTPDRTLSLSQVELDINSS